MTPQPVIDFVKLPERYTPYTEKKLDDEVLRRHFGELGAIQIHFVPAMLRELVMHTANELADRLVEVRDHRLKKHTRLLRDAVAKQRGWLDRRKSKGAGDETAAYGKRYIDLVVVQCWLFRLGFEEQCRNKYPDIDATTAALVNLAAVIATYARRYEVEMNRRIGVRLGAPVRKDPDLCPTIVHAICVDIAEEYGYKLEISNDARLWVEILSKKALELCEFCYNEEHKNN